VYDDDVPAAQNCVSCGTHVTAATSFLTEHGLLCWPCRTRMQNHQEARARAVNDLAHSLARRAMSNAQAHGLMWMVGFILIAHWARLPGWLGGVLLLAALALSFGLAWCKRWAFWTALTLDIAATLVLILLGATGPMTGAPLAIMFLAVFPLALTALVWTLRKVYLRSFAGTNPTGTGLTLR
jgi:hypothetical protein